MDMAQCVENHGRREWVRWKGENWKITYLGVHEANNGMHALSNNCPWHDGTKEVATLVHFHNMRVIYGTTYLFGILCIAAHMLGRITTLFRNFRFLVENFGPWNLPWEEFFVWMSKSKLLLHQRVELKLGTQFFSSCIL